MDNLIVDIPQIVALVPVMPSIITAAICEGYVLDEDTGSAVNGLWAYPLNAVTVLATVSLFPVAALVALVAAAIFKLIAVGVDCFSSNDNEWHVAAEETLGVALFDILSIAQAFASIVKPDLNDKEWMPEFAVEWRN